MAELTTAAKERSTYGITVTFTDENGDAVVPSAATWTLMDAAGNVINSRQDVSISSLASSVTITLSGDDLAIDSGGRRQRVLLVEATYSSDLGSDLPFKDTVAFAIENLVGV